MVDAVYVGNLSESTTEEDLKLLFAKFGEVQSIKIIREFALVKLMNAKAMKLAAKELNEVKFKGKKLKTSCAIERKS
ncbi:MAG: recognition motif [Gammaproteobacteria bacterium]|jgi:RNA recognition motif-containing protein|nr:recognition motif [Gammaproteobacteria bacterium]